MLPPVGGMYSWLKCSPKSDLVGGFLPTWPLTPLLAPALQATVLIETLPAAFEMDEILWELRQHSAGLNCGRWDYIFSFIKTLRADPKAVMPDRCALSGACSGAPGWLHG